MFVSENSSLNFSRLPWLSPLLSCHLPMRDFLLKSRSARWRYTVRVCICCLCCLRSLHVASSRDRMPMCLRVSGRVTSFDGGHTWEGTKVTTWVLCVSIHRHTSSISAHHTCRSLLCLYKSLSAWWSLIPGCFRCQVLLLFRPVHPLPSLPLSSLLSLMCFPADSLLAFIGPNIVRKLGGNN